MTETVKLPAKLNTPAFREAWAEWVEHRKEIKKKMTERSARMLLKQCETWGPRRSVEAIQWSIAQGYRGLFENPQLNRRTETPTQADERVREQKRAEDQAMRRREELERFNADQDKRIAIVTGLSTEQREEIRRKLAEQQPNEVMKRAIQNGNPLGGGRLTDLIYGEIEAQKIAEEP